MNTTRCEEQRGLIGVAAQCVDTGRFGEYVGDRYDRHWLTVNVDDRN